MKKLWFIAPLLFCLPALHAQNAIDFGVGFGSAWDSRAANGLEGYGTLLNPSANPLGACTLPGDQFCQATSGFSPFMLGFSGDVMFKEHFGGGFEYNIQPSRQNYGPLQSRVSFLDVNGIYAPVVKKRYSIQLQGGIGDARTSFAISQSGCVGTAVVCSTSTQAVGSSTHFQLHVGAGVQINVTDHIFVRPQFDLHYVPGFTDQWGRNSVPEAMVFVGYHFGSN